MYSATLVGIEWRKFASSCSSDSPARAPSTRRRASALGTKPCQCTSVAARLDVRAGRRVRLADQLDRDAVRRQQPAELHHLGRAPVRGEPADVDDAARPGRRRRRRRGRRSCWAPPGGCREAVVVAVLGQDAGAGGARPAARRRCTPPAATGRSQPGSHAFVVSAAAVSSCTSQTVGGRRAPGRQHQQQLGVVHQQQVRAAPPARPSRPARRAARPAGAGPTARGMVTVVRVPRPVRVRIPGS